MTERFTCNSDKHCACGEPARPGQRNCLTCAAEANKAYRLRQKAKRAAEHNLALAGIMARVRETNRLRAKEKGEG